MPEKKPAGSRLAKSAKTPPERLLQLAYDHPELVLQNPILPLLALEDPDFWGRIVGAARCEIAEREVRRLLEGVSLPLRVALAVTCVERVLPWYEEANPGRGLPRRALAAVQAWARSPSEKGARALQPLDDALLEDLRSRTWEEKRRVEAVVLRAAVEAVGAAVAVYGEGAERARILVLYAMASAAGAAGLRAAGPGAKGSYALAQAAETEAQLVLARAVAGG